jgi:GDP-D-mannose dehydratase
MILGASGQDGTLMRKKLGNTKVVNVSSRPIQKAPNAKEINVIIESYDMLNLKRLLMEHKPNVVINFTGLSSVAECDDFPHRSLDLNFHVVENLVQGLIDSKITNYTFMQCTSSEMFCLGELLCNEEREMNPVTIYGKHKLKASEFLSSEIPDNLLNLILFNHESEFRTENFVTKKL